MTLSSQRLVDLPEGEGTQWRRFSTTRWATSANHLYGRPVTSSETWTWLHSPVFRATPLDMKAEADLHFLQGVNQLVAHGWPYTPPSVPEPGWRFYAAAVFNQHNPWWIVMPDITTYLQRVSWILRQGTPANDVAVYLPTHDAFAGFTLGTRLGQSGDGRADRAERWCRRFWMPATTSISSTTARSRTRGITHKILIVPNVERIPLATYQKIAEYAAKGGNVIFTRRLPSLAPGLREEGDTAKIRELSRQVPGDRAKAKLGDALHAALPADFTVPAEVGVVHRKLPYSDIYFLANTSNHPVKGKAAFRVSGNAGGVVGSIHRQRLRRRTWIWIWRRTNRACWCSRRKAPPADSRERSGDSAGGREQRLERQVPGFAAGGTDGDAAAVDRR